MKLWSRFDKCLLRVELNRAAITIVLSATF